MKKFDKSILKESFLKSIVYRIITVILGFITALIITGDIVVALGVAMLTEVVQFINYFIFELIWTNLITKKRLIEELKKIIKLDLNYDAILELAYQMSQTDTFMGEVYLSALNFLNSILKNEDLKEIHDQVSKYLEHFKHTHRKREFASFKSHENSEIE